MQFAGTP